MYLSGISVGSPIPELAGIRMYPDIPGIRIGVRMGLGGVLFDAARFILKLTSGSNLYRHVKRHVGSTSDLVVGQNNFFESCHPLTLNRYGIMG